MAHFNLRQGLFQSKGELAKYINDDGKEYISYGYDFEEDILPAINNLLPNVQKVEIKRELKNIKVFLQGDGIGICFRNFDFDSIDSTGLLMGTGHSLSYNYKNYRLPEGKEAFTTNHIFA